MSRVLVTGANGFLGSWLTRRLLQEGHQTYALVRKSSDLSELDGVSCEYLYGDVTDPESLYQAFRNMDTIFHLAGLIAYKKADRDKMERVNVQGTKNVIEACVQNRVRRLVYLSSVVAIGAGFNPGQILNEESDFNIHHLNLGYFETKRKAEQLVKEACTAGRLDAVMLNPSTIYGAGDARKSSRKNQVKVARGELKFYTSGGVNVVAIEDVIDGILAGWQRGRNGERYILSSENLLIKDLFARIAQEAGQKPPFIAMPSFVLHLAGILGDLATSMGFRAPISRENAWTATLYHWFDSGKARRELGFRPRPAQAAIHNSVQWMKDNSYLS